MIEGNERRIGTAAWVMAWVGLIGGQLHALARHRTDDGRSDLDSGVVRAWAEPAGDLLDPLLSWASADAVYLTYGKLWLPVFVAFALAAFLVHRRRRPTGFEKWTWRVVLTAYVLACVAVAAEYWTMWSAINDALLDGVFLASLPIMLVTMLSTTVLGVTMLVKGAPRVPSALLACALPGVFVISTFTSLGNVVLPIAFAFGILGRRIARSAEVEEAAPSAVTAPA